MLLQPRGIPISRGDVSSQLAGASRKQGRGLANWKFINELNYRIRYFYRATANVHRGPPAREIVSDDIWLCARLPGLTAANRICEYPPLKWSGVSSGRGTITITLRGKRSRARFLFIVRTGLVIDHR